MTIFARAFAAALMAAAIALATSRPAGAFEILVPAYIYPSVNGTTLGGDWARLADAARDGYQVTAILNPNSGAGDAIDLNYLRAAFDVRCGICSQVIGFTYTNWGQRPIGEVKAEIDRYYQWYPVSGIFVDELPSEAQMSGPARDGYLRYYSEIYSYIQSKSGAFTKPDGTPVATGTRVIANPGTRADEIWLTGGVTSDGRPVGRGADALLVFENTYTSLTDGSYVPSPWNTARDYSDALGYIVHTSGAGDLASALEIIRSRGADIAFVTDGSMRMDPSGPGFTDARYSQLPSYWDRLLAAANCCTNKVDEPGVLALLGGGLAMLPFLAGRRRPVRAA